MAEDLVLNSFVNKLRDLAKEVLDMREDAIRRIRNAVTTAETLQQRWNESGYSGVITDEQVQVGNNQDITAENVSLAVTSLANIIAELTAIETTVKNLFTENYDSTNMQKIRKD